MLPESLTAESTTVSASCRSCRKGLHKRRLRETASAHAGDKDNMDDSTSDEAVETPVMTKSPQQQLQQTEVSADEAARDTRLSSGAETYHDRVHERVAVGTAAVPQISWTEQNLQRYMHDYSSPGNMFAAAGEPVRSPAAAAAAVLGTLLKPAAPAAVPVSQTSLIDSLLDEEMMNCIKEGGNEHLTAASTAELESLLETELLAAAAAAAVGPVASNVRSLMPYRQLAPYSPAYRNQHQHLAMTAATNNFAGRAASSLLGTEAAQVPAPPTLEVLQQKLTKIQSTLLKLKHLREQQLSAVQGYHSTATWEQYIGGFDMMTGLMQGGCLEGTPFEMHV